MKVNKHVLKPSSGQTHTHTHIRCSSRHPSSLQVMIYTHTYNRSKTKQKPTKRPIIKQQYSIVCSDPDVYMRVIRVCTCVFVCLCNAFLILFTQPSPFKGRSTMYYETIPLPKGQLRQGNLSEAVTVGTLRRKVKRERIR